MDIEASAVLRVIDEERERILGDVAACVRIPSVVGHEGPVQEFMRGLYVAEGLDVDVFEADQDALQSNPAFVRTIWPTHGRPNVVGTRAGSDVAARSLAINGHVDVVSPEPVSAWTHDPWGGERNVVDGEERLYGRGALDMKSGTIAAFHALRAVRVAGFRPRGTVILQSVVEEEAGGGAGTLATLLRGHVADALLNPEPFHRTVVLGQPGVMLFRISVQGKTAHAAYSQHGVNAIGKLLPIYEAMVHLDAERAARWRDPFWGALSDRAVNLNIGTFQAGDWPSTVAGKASMECRISFIPPQTQAIVRREVENRIAEVAERDPWLREHPPVVEWFGWQAEPWRQDADHPFIGVLARTIAELGGGTPPLVSATAGLDTRFCGALGIAAACTGARGDAMHGADEYVTVDSVIETVQVIAATIVAWCGVTS